MNGPDGLEGTCIWVFECRLCGKSTVTPGKTVMLLLFVGFSRLPSCLFAFHTNWHALTSSCQAMLADQDMLLPTCAAL